MQMRGWPGMVAAVALAVAAGLAATPLAAQVEIKIVSGDGPQHEGVKAYIDVARWIEERSGGRITARVFPQTLLSVKEIPSGLRDGVADMGLIVHPYHPAEFPEANFIADFSLFATNNYAAAGAASEYIFTCEECMAEMADYGHIYLGNIANAPYSLLTKVPVTTIADLQGRKIRSGGEAWGRWIEAMGGIKVSIPAAETYQALSQGMLDIHTHSIGSLVDQSLVDLLKHVTDMPLGVYLGASNNYSAARWEALSAEDRAVVFEIAPYMLARYVTGLVANNNRVRARLGELGVTLHEPAPELVTATQEFLARDIATVAELGERNYGIQNAAAKAERFVALLKKWEGLTEGMPADWEQLGNLYRDEIFAHLDRAAFGL